MEFDPVDLVRFGVAILVGVVVSAVGQDAGVHIIPTLAIALVAGVVVDDLLDRALR